MSRGTLVSVIVPTLDEEAELPGVLDHLDSLPGEWEVLVADGGSTDATVEVARARGARVTSAGTTRAAQLNAAAADSSGELLLFLHADSRLPRDAWASLARQPPQVMGGNFALRFTGGGLFARVLTAAYALQRRGGFYYGDSSIWVRRSAFQRLGGYRDVPIMDDYDFARRLERGFRTARLSGPGAHLTAALACGRGAAHAADLVGHPPAVSGARAAGAAGAPLRTRALSG